MFHILLSIAKIVWCFSHDSKDLVVTVVSVPPGSLSTKHSGVCFGDLQRWLLQAIPIWCHLVDWFAALPSWLVTMVLILRWFDGGLVEMIDWWMVIQQYRSIIISFLRTTHISYIIYLSYTIYLIYSILYIYTYRPCRYTNCTAVDLQANLIFHDIRSHFSSGCFKNISMEQLSWKFGKGCHRS